MSDWQFFNYETDSKLACSCCGEQGMSDQFMQRIDALRADYGKPLTVTSGYRCPAYNQRVSSTGEDGPHTTGLAIDLHVSGEDAHTLLDLAFTYQFSGIGIAQKGNHGARFIHLDDISTGNRPWVWSY